MTTTTILSLRSADELRSNEQLAAIPDLVQKYLDMVQSPKLEGDYFRIIVKRDFDAVQNHGCAYFNEFKLEQKRSELWGCVHTTGRLQYRAARAHEADHWEHEFGVASILEESPSKVTYAVATGDGRITVYRFNRGRDKVVSFDYKGHKAAVERLRQLDAVTKDPAAFAEYVQKSFGERWMRHHDPIAFDGQGNKLEDAANAHLVVIPAVHADQPYDAVIDQYKVYVWMRGCGIGEAGPFRTGLRHPFGRFYFVGLDFKAEVAMENSRPRLTVAAWNNGQKWHDSTTFDIRVGGGKNI
ncbi:MAG: hypothetical protein Q7S26_00025 [bacterium]|nr:hypothetical protein [bacterium]